MRLTPEDFDFIIKNKSEDISKLLLKEGKNRYNINLLADQIISRRKIKDKVPSFYNNSAIIYPNPITAEQCSSEITAEYKSTLVESSSIIDLTGGLGVDSLLFSRKCEKVTYIERDPYYCEVAKENFATLNANNISVINSDCCEYINNINIEKGTDFYIDPARRGNNNKKLSAIEDCEPNILDIKRLLITIGNNIIIKLSPMLDISETLRKIPESREIHIISVKNECKEILIKIPCNHIGQNNQEIITINFTQQGLERFSFTLDEERELNIQYAHTIFKYLYEPNSSIMKGGGFKSIAGRYKEAGLLKVDTNSHLYTSDSPIIGFPGRSFKVTKIAPYSKKSIKNIAKGIRNINISVRNGYTKPEDIKKIGNFKDGGDNYLFVTKTDRNNSVIILCSKMGS